MLSVTGAERTPLIVEAITPPAMLSGRASLDARRHFGDGHQRLGELIEKLIGILLLTKRHRKHLHDSRLTELCRKITGRCVPRNLVMLHLLCCADQGKIR